MSNRDVLAALEPFRRFRSTLHGPAHWARVHRFALVLAAQLKLPRPQRYCVEVFAWLHDLARVDDGGGRQHAIDGAEQVRTFASQVFPALSEDQVFIVKLAIRHHSDGLTADVAAHQGLFSNCAWPTDLALNTVACCWDADRLDLLRLGREPLNQYMSTPFWRDILPLARQLHGFSSESDELDLSSECGE